MRSITIFIESQRLNYLQKQKTPTTEEPKNEYFKKIQQSFKGDDKPSLLSRLKSIFTNRD